MGVSREQNWEWLGWTEGATITATSSANSGDAITTVGTTGTRQATATQKMHGAWAARIIGAATGTTGIAFTSLATTNPEGAIVARGYLLLEALPTTTTTSEVLAYTTGSGTPAVRYRISPAGLVQVSDLGGSAWTTVGTIAAGTFYRFEFSATIGTDATSGTIVAALYAGDSAAPLTSVVTLTGRNTGSVAWSNVQVGKLTSSAETYATVIDSLKVVTGSTTFLGPYVPPSAGRQCSTARASKSLEFAMIGDSTLAYGSSGESTMRARMAQNGYDDAKLFFYAVSSKAINIPDTNGKTTLQNIAEARAYFGGRDPSGGYLFNLGSNGHNSPEATNRARVAEVMGAIDASTRVVWVGLANAASHADAATRAAFNVLMQDILTAYPNAEWYDQQRYLQNWDQATMWTDGVHHTAAGTAAKFGGLVVHLPAPSTSVIPATLLREGRAALAA